MTPVETRYFQRTLSSKEEGRDLDDDDQDDADDGGDGHFEAHQDPLHLDVGPCSAEFMISCRYHGLSVVISCRDKIVHVRQ